jgi:hypothetical protein
MKKMEKTSILSPAIKRAAILTTSSSDTAT